MDILSQVEATKAPKILDVFRCFRGKKLQQKIHRFAEKEFLEVPNHLPPLLVFAYFTQIDYFHFPFCHLISLIRTAIGLIYICNRQITMIHHPLISPADGKSSWNQLQTLGIDDAVIAVCDGIPSPGKVGNNQLQPHIRELLAQSADTSGCLGIKLSVTPHPKCGNVIILNRRPYRLLQWR